MPRAIDGSNWTGVLAGTFYPEDYRVNEKTKEVWYWNGQDIVAENLVIPNYVWYRGQKFKVILDKTCFDGSSTLVGSVELNDWADGIGDSVFKDCVNITSIIFHDYPKHFDSSALEGCIYLSNIYVRKDENTFDPDWTINVEHIESFAFAGTALTGELIFTSSLQTLGDGAFQLCKHITEVNLRFSKRIRVIAPSTFQSCVLMEWISLPSSIQVIGESAFESCSKLYEVILESENQHLTLESGAFRECANFVNFSEAPIVKKIGEACFYNDKSIEFTPWLDKRNEGLSIARNAFGRCGFSGVEFNNTIHINVDTFGFSDCNQLKMVDFSSFGVEDVPLWEGENVFDSTATNGKMIVKQEVYEDVYSYGEWWHFFNDVFGWQKLTKQGWTFKIK